MCRAQGCDVIVGEENRGVQRDVGTGSWMEGGAIGCAEEDLEFI